MAGMVTIGVLREVPKLDASGKPVFESKLDESGNQMSHVAVMRGVGQRIAHPLMLERVAVFMRCLGEADAELAVRRWLDDRPDKVAGPTAMQAALARVEQHSRTFLEKEMRREAAYCDLAWFILQCCLDEVGAS